MAIYKSCRQVLGEDPSFRSYVSGSIASYDVCVFGRGTRFAQQGNLIFVDPDTQPYSSFERDNGVLIDKDVVVDIRGIFFRLKNVETDSSSFTRDDMYYRVRLYVGTASNRYTVLAEKVFNLEVGEYCDSFPDFSGIFISGSSQRSSVFLAVDHLVNDTAPRSDVFFRCRFTVRTL